MQVDVVEMGDRPTVMTKARRFAPEGARIFGAYLSELSFADGAALVLDWSNEMGGLPIDVSKPILYVRVIKKLPQFERRNVLTIDERLDVEDVFGNDTMTADYIRDLVHELEEKIDQQVTQRKREG